MKQNKYTDKDRTEKLIALGLTPEQNGGFQIHELINLIPDRIEFRKSHHYDGTVFIDWKRKRRFTAVIKNHIGGRWGYDLRLYDDNSRLDQAQLEDQLVNLLAELIIYLRTSVK